jgi:predicted RNase H-like nuclease (RuvC/YqgF family)
MLDVRTCTLRATATPEIHNHVDPTIFEGSTMWSRLTEGLADIVAPEEGERGQQHEDEEQDQLWSRLSAVVAPPVASEEDEQEQYICELERALLQRKKANEALEKKLKDLETRTGDDKQLEQRLRGQQVEIAQQKTAIERLQAARHDAMTGDEGSDSHRDLLLQELQQSRAEVSFVVFK